jgi:hypothetical protein
VADQMGRFEDRSGLDTNQLSASEPPRPSRGHRVEPLGSGAKVVSERQLGTNRRSAKLSTGPRSAVGKAKVAQNAYKSGAYSLETGHVRLVLEAATDLEAGGGGVYLGPSGPTWVVLDRLVSEEAFISSTDLADLAPEYPEVGWAELAAHLASTLEPGLSAEHPALPSSDSGQVR